MVSWVKKPKFIIPALFVIAAGIVIFALLYQPAKKIVPYDTGTNSSTVTKEVELSNGKKVDVATHQLMIKVTNSETLKSFGDSIEKTAQADVYIITVKTGDLVQAAQTIRQKPGVVWTTPIQKSDTTQ